MPLLQRDFEVVAKVIKMTDKVFNDEVVYFTVEESLKGEIDMQNRSDHASAREQ